MHELPLHPDDRRDDTVGFDLHIAGTNGVKISDAGLFHETDIVGVMRHAHPVGLVVVDFVMIDKHFWLILPCKDK